MQAISEDVRCTAVEIPGDAAVRRALEVLILSPHLILTLRFLLLTFVSYISSFDYFRPVYLYVVHL